MAACDAAVSSARAQRCQSGSGLVEILVVAVILAVAGAFLYQSFASTTKTVETIQQQKPMSAARLAADRATVAAIQTSLQLYFGQPADTLQQGGRGDASEPAASLPV